MLVAFWALRSLGQMGGGGGPGQASPCMHMLAGALQQLCPTSLHLPPQAFLMTPLTTPFRLPCFAGPLLAISPLPSLSATVRGGLDFPAKGCFLQLRGYPTNRGQVPTELNSIRRGLAGAYTAAHEVCKRVATLKVRRGEEVECDVGGWGR